jgi:hypothetical protein
MRTFQITVKDKWVGTVSGVLAGLLIYFYIDFMLFKPSSTPDYPRIILTNYANSDRTVSELTERLQQIFTNRPAVNGTEVFHQMNNLSTRIELVDASLTNVSVRLRLLEDAISSTPDKALSIPLLRRDVDDIRQQLIHDRAIAKADLDRIYDFSKWFFGLMGAAVVGFFTSQLKAKEKGEKKLAAG